MKWRVGHWVLSLCGLAMAFAAHAREGETQEPDYWNQTVVRQLFEDLMNPSPTVTDASEFFYGEHTVYFGQLYANGRPYHLVPRFDWSKAFNPLVMTRNYFKAASRKDVELPSDIVDRYHAQALAGLKFREAYVQKLWHDLLLESDFELASLERDLTHIITIKPKRHVEHVRSPIDLRTAQRNAAMEFVSIYHVPHEEAPELQRQYLELINRQLLVGEEHRRREAAEQNIPLRSELGADLDAFAKRVRELIATANTQEPPGGAHPNHPFGAHYRWSLKQALREEMLDIAMGGLRMIRGNSTVEDIYRMLEGSFDKYTPFRVINAHEDETMFKEFTGAKFRFFLNNLKWWGLSQSPQYWEERDNLAWKKIPSWKHRWVSPESLRDNRARGASKRRHVGLVAAVSIKTIVQMAAVAGLWLTAGIQYQKNGFGRGSPFGVPDVNPQLQSASFGNGRGAQSVGIYKVTHGNGNPFRAPLPFIFASNDTFGASPYEIPPQADKLEPRRASIILKSTTELPLKRYIHAIPTPLGYRLSFVDFGVEHNYALYRRTSGEFVLIHKFPAETITSLDSGSESDVRSASLRVGFVPDEDYVPSQKLPKDFESLDKAWIAHEGESLFRTGFKALGRNLIRLSESGKPVSLVNLADTISSSMVYSIEKPPAWDHEIRHLPEDNPLSMEERRGLSMAFRWFNTSDKPRTRYEDFLENRYLGHFVGKCDHGNQLFHQMTHDLPIFLPSADNKKLSRYEITQVDEFVPDNAGLLRYPAHRQTLLLKDSKPVYLFDTTPRVTTSFSKVPKGGRPPVDPAQWKASVEWDRGRSSQPLPISRENRNFADRWRRFAEPDEERSPHVGDEDLGSESSKRLEWEARDHDLDVRHSTDRLAAARLDTTERMRREQLKKLLQLRDSLMPLLKNSKLVPEQHGDLPLLRAARLNEVVIGILEGRYNSEWVRQRLGKDFDPNLSHDIPRLIVAASEKIEKDLEVWVSRMRNDVAFRQVLAPLSPRAVVRKVEDELFHAQVGAASAIHQDAQRYANGMSGLTYCAVVLNQLAQR
jgi:hypothetical protein